MKSEKGKVRELLEKAQMHDAWAKEHPCWIDGVLENLNAAKNIRIRLEDLGKIQDCCTHGYVLPDRCRYSSRTGCDCGAYPAIS